MASVLQVLGKRTSWSSLPSSLAIARGTQCSRKRPKHLYRCQGETTSFLHSAWLISMSVTWETCCSLRSCLLQQEMERNPSPRVLALPYTVASSSPSLLYLSRLSASFLLPMPFMPHCPGTSFGTSLLGICRFHCHSFLLCHVYLILEMQNIAIDLGT